MIRSRVPPGALWYPRVLTGGAGLTLVPARPVPVTSPRRRNYPYAAATVAGLTPSRAASDRTEGS